MTDQSASRNWRSDRPTVEGVYETRCPEHTGDKVFHSRWLNRRWCVDRADADEAAGQWGPSMIQEGREWRGEPMKVGVIRSERGTSEPVAWRYRYGSAGMEWRYVDRREDVNPSPDYEVQPLYERSER